MKVLVCGGRDFKDQKLFDQTMHDVAVEIVANQDKDLEIIEGDAPGADRMAKRWGITNGYNVYTYPADWDTHGKRAGFLRNQQMLDEGKPDLVVAFPGGRGTAMMIDLAKKAGVRVIKIETVSC